MSEAVKGSRNYESPRRRRQAAQTRADILAAAEKLLRRDGYARTTLAAIAADAQVSIQTVANSVGTKPALFKALIDVRIAGDDDDTPMRERPWVRRIDEEPDPRRKLSMYAARLDETQQRVGPLQVIAREAASAEPELAALRAELDAQRLAGMTALAGMLSHQGHLRHGITGAAAAELLYSLASPEMYDLLVVGRNWSRRHYRQWLTDALCAALLPPPTVPAEGGQADR